MRIKKLILTEEQNSIYVKISNQINQNLKQIILSGIPGSGKTELYIKLIQDVISKKQEAIVLVPEISLTKQEQPIEIGLEEVSDKNLYLKVYDFNSYENAKKLLKLLILIISLLLKRKTRVIVFYLDR